MNLNTWRRTAFEDASGSFEVAPDDWTLLDPSGEPLARLYKVFGGPQDGRWYWTVLFRPDGSVGNGGTGFAAAGREAREACGCRLQGRAGGGGLRFPCETVPEGHFGEGEGFGYRRSPTIIGCSKFR